MKEIKHVFFDLDHTLWDFESNSNDSFKDIFATHQVAVDFDLFMKAYTPINNEYWKRYREDRVSKEDLRYGRLKDTFDALNYETSDALIDVLAEDYITTLPKYNKLFPGAIQVLEYLKSKDYALHMITNGFEEVQWKKCVSSGIDHFFTEFITSEAVGVKKPNPKIFKFALEKADAHADQSIMIGDNQEADIQGALSMGMQVVFCNFDSQINKGNYKEIHHLEELKNIL
ncbi:MAG: YjjG family noncanonical pyrimidine nucleotidase [Flavobacteriaceae bacterium]